MDRLEKEFKSWAEEYADEIWESGDERIYQTRQDYLAGVEKGFQNCKKRFLSALQKRLVQFTNDDGERILPPIPLGLFLADVVKEVEEEE